MEETVKETLAAIGFEYDREEDHCHIRHRDGALLVWKNLSMPGHCLAYDTEEGLSILMRTNIDIIVEEAKSRIRDARIDEVLGN